MTHVSGRTSLSGPIMLVTVLRSNGRSLCLGDTFDINAGRDLADPR